MHRQLDFSVQRQFPRSLLSLFSPSGRRARLSILIYHRVLPELDALLPGEPDADRFRWQMELLAKYCHPLPLEEAVTRLRAGTLPSRAVCVTFDDGYADNATVALPILHETGVPATFFIATGYLNGGIMFNDVVIEVVRRVPTGMVDFAEEGSGVRRIVSDADRVSVYTDLIQRLKYLPLKERSARAAALAERLGVRTPDDLMMTTEQLRGLAASGMEIGGHTHSHPILTRVDHATARREMQEGKERLERLLGHPVKLFAFPNGRPGKDFEAEHVNMVRECGFEAAVTTAWGTAGRESDLFQLPRFTPWDKTPLRFGLRLVRNLMVRGSRATSPAALESTPIHRNRRHVRDGAGR